jgi:hypothetical protein
MLALISLAVYCIVDGIGCLSSARLSNDKPMFVISGVCSILAGLAFAAASTILEKTYPDLLAFVMIFATGAVFFGVVTQRFKMWNHDWRPVRAVAKQVKDRDLFANIWEMRILAGLWVASITFSHRIELPMWVSILWYVSGSIAAVRAFDPPASVGIAANTFLRKFILFITRSTVALALLLFFKSNL